MGARERGEEVLLTGVGKQDGVSAGAEADDERSERRVNE